MIGDDVIVHVVEVQGDNVRIAIEAPREVKSTRGEITHAIQAENTRAATPANIDLRGALPQPE